MAVVGIVGLVLNGVLITTNLMQRNRKVHETIQSRTFQSEANMNKMLTWLGQNLSTDAYSVDRHEAVGNVFEVVVWFKDVADAIKMDAANLSLYFTPEQPQ